MQRIYPLNIVITENNLLKSAYNSDPQSALLLSACLSPKKLQRYFQKNFQVDTLISVDNSFEDFLSLVGNTDSVSSYPDFVHYNYPGAINCAIEELHKLLMTPIALCGMGDG